MPAECSDIHQIENDSSTVNSASLSIRSSEVWGKNLLRIKWTRIFIYNARTETIGRLFNIKYWINRRHRQQRIYEKLAARKQHKTRS